MRGSFLQGPEGVLHVLQQLGEVRFDLSFAILNRVLRDDTKMNGRDRISEEFIGAIKIF